jgi:gluconolactonase
MDTLSNVGIAFAALMAVSAPGSAQESPIAGGAKLERLPGRYSFTEGPCADASGVVYFTDQPNDAIYRAGLDGKVELFMRPSGRSNGMSFTRDGALVSCADLKNELWLIDPKSGKARVIAKNFSGKALNGPNDAYVLEDGGIYLTDPFYKRDWWDHDAMPQDRQAVYYLPPGGGALIRVADDLDKPNGITGTPDGKFLLVADIGAGKTWKYSINADRSLGSKTLFCSMGSDGMTIDSQGNVYLTGKGVTIFDSAGKQIGFIPVAEDWTANACFGGADRDWLYITASGSVYRIRMKTRGARPFGK